MEEKKTMQKAARDSLAHVPQPVRKAVGLVLEYLWDDELQNFLAHIDQGSKAEVGEHVFVALCRLRSYVEGRDHDPRFYLAKAADCPKGKTVRSSALMRA